MEQIIKITEFIIDSFIHIWPYLLVTIPLAVIVQVTGVAKFINKALSKKPIVSILLATIVGAFSPFCSCGVIPIIASLLISGVPLAPVMSFWIASPSMDPEIFFLSTAVIGLKMSVWRLVGTFVISLLSGYITHFATIKGYIGKDIFKKNQVTETKWSWRFIALKIVKFFRNIVDYKKPSKIVQFQIIGVNSSGNKQNVNCCIETNELAVVSNIKSSKSDECNSCEKSEPKPISFRNKLMNETWKASVMVVKFMAIAFLINALITFYVPQDFIAELLGGDGYFSVFIATLVGIPAYTSNITALPMVSGLLDLGMNKGAALAFLIAGPTTTLPAMVAVWGITKKKIFMLYVSFSLIGAIVFGLLYNFIN